MNGIEVIQYVPENQTGGSNETVNEPKKRNPISNITKYFTFLRIALKLALINAYNDEFQIRGRLGSYIKDTNLMNLLHYALTPGKVPLAEDDFVALLKEAKIDPVLIKQESLKKKLEKLLVSDHVRTSNTSTATQTNHNIDDLAVPLQTPPTPSIEAESIANQEPIDLTQENSRILKTPVRRLSKLPTKRIHPDDQDNHDNDSLDGMPQLSPQTDTPSHFDWKKQKLD